MKRHVKASSHAYDVEHYVNQCVRNIANYFYNNINFNEDSPYMDYFIENVCKDPEVTQKKKELVEALFNAKARSLGYNA